MGNPYNGPAAVTWLNMFALMVIKALHINWSQLAACGHTGSHCSFSKSKNSTMMALMVVIALHNVVTYGHSMATCGHTW